MLNEDDMLSITDQALEELIDATRTCWCEAYDEGGLLRFCSETEFGPAATVTLKHFADLVQSLCFSAFASLDGKGDSMMDTLKSSQGGHTWSS